MPNSAQARKRLRQDEVRNLRNRMAKSEIKTLTKKVLAAVNSGNLEEAQTWLVKTQARLDKAAKVGTFHKNTVARRKSQLYRRVESLQK